MLDSECVRQTFWSKVILEVIMIISDSLGDTFLDMCKISSLQLPFGAFGFKMTIFVEECKSQIPTFFLAFF